MLVNLDQKREWREGEDKRNENPHINKRNDKNKKLKIEGFGSPSRNIKPITSTPKIHQSKSKIKQTQFIRPTNEKVKIEED